MKTLKNYDDYLNEKFTKIGPASDSEINNQNEPDDDGDFEKNPISDDSESDLEKLEVGDEIIHTGDSSFCHDSKEKIDKITIKYDEDTGKPYRVIHIKSGQKFDSRTGGPLTPPWAYYIKTIK